MNHPVGGRGTTVIVWEKMRQGDSLKAAQRSSRMFAGSSVRQFWDENSDTGRLVAESLGLAVPVAWDIYIFLEEGARWDDSGALPARDWIHQLRGTHPERFKTGADIARHLQQVVEALTAR